MILHEFDENKEAIVNPGFAYEKIENFPKIAISCFSRRTFNRILEKQPHREIGIIDSANIIIPIYEIEYEGLKIALFNSYVGASGCVAFLEELVYFGMKKLILFGSCGVLDKNIKQTSIIIPDSAIRDEGTSFHYAPASDEISVNEKYGKVFEEFLKEVGINYTKGKVWTTDGFYRETKEKAERRKKQGAICVDMECSAVSAFANFRKIDVLHFFYSADNLDADEWDRRTLGNGSDLEEKDKFYTISLMMAKKMMEE